MNPYSRLAQQMEQRGSRNNPSELQIATIISLTPLSIKIGDAAPLSENIYINPLSISKSDIESLDTEETELKQCLKEIYSAFKLDVNDKAVVQRSGNNFFILGKVVGV